MIINIIDVFPSLTRRQRQVCALLVKGYTAKQTGYALGISDRTVEDHRTAILVAADAENVAEVVFKLFGEPEIIA